MTYILGINRDFTLQKYELFQFAPRKTQNNLPGPIKAQTATGRIPFKRARAVSAGLQTNLVEGGAESDAKNIPHEGVLPAPEPGRFGLLFGLP